MTEPQIIVIAFKNYHERERKKFNITQIQKLIKMSYNCINNLYVIHQVHNYLIIYISV